MIEQLLIFTRDNHKIHIQTDVLNFQFKHPKDESSVILNTFTQNEIDNNFMQAKKSQATILNNSHTKRTKTPFTG